MPREPRRSTHRRRAEVVHHVVSDPDAPDHVLARRCRVPAATVRIVREELGCWRRLPRPRRPEPEPEVAAPVKVHQPRSTRTQRPSETRPLTHAAVLSWLRRREQASGYGGTAGADDVELAESWGVEPGEGRQRLRWLEWSGYAWVDETGRHRAVLGAGPWCETRARAARDRRVLRLGQRDDFSPHSGRRPC